MGASQVIIPALIALLVSGVTSALTGFAPPYGQIAGLLLAAAAAVGLWRTWPRAPTPEWALKQVSDFVLGYSDWNFDNPSQPPTKIMNLLTALSQAAANQEITAWGSRYEIPSMRVNVRVHASPIPVEHWGDYQIDMEKFWGNGEGITARLGHEPDSGSYYALQFDSRQIKRLHRRFHELSERHA